MRFRTFVRRVLQSSCSLIVGTGGTFVKGGFADSGSETAPGVATDAALSGRKACRNGVPPRADQKTGNEGFSAGDSDSGKSEIEKARTRTKGTRNGCLAPQL